MPRFSHILNPITRKFLERMEQLKQQGKLAEVIANCEYWKSCVSYGVFLPITMVGTKWAFDRSFGAAPSKNSKQIGSEFWEPMMLQFAQLGAAVATTEIAQNALIELNWYLLDCYIEQAATDSSILDDETTQLTFKNACANDTISQTSKYGLWYALYLGKKDHTVRTLLEQRDSLLTWLNNNIAHAPEILDNQSNLRTAFWYAGFNREWWLAIELIKNGNVDVNTTPVDGLAARKTVLWFLVATATSEQDLFTPGWDHSKSELLGYLIVSDAHFNNIPLPNLFHGANVMWFAAKLGLWHKVEQLILDDADLNQIPRQGMLSNQTILSLAIQANREGVIEKILIKNGIDLLLYLQTNFRFDVLKELVDNNGIVNDAFIDQIYEHEQNHKNNNNVKSGLSSLIFKGKINVVKQIIKSSYDKQIANNEIITTLCKYDLPVICNYLDEVSEEIPDDFKCPVSHGLILDPVRIKGTMHLFDRAHVYTWVEKNPRNPLAGNAVHKTDIKAAPQQLIKDIVAHVDQSCKKISAQKSGRNSPGLSS